MSLAREPRAGGLRLRAAEDRDAAAARRDDDRLGVARDPARRRPAGVLLGRHQGGRRAARRPATSRARPPETHRIVRADAHRSAVYSGSISGRGPRYCPSIEDKVVRFADRDSHQIFLEPEGLDDPTVYPNGISTSLPAETQRALIATIPGLERARILRAGYAIEYDYVDPRGLEPTLEARRFRGPVPGRADQRHDRLRGGGGAGAGRRDQRGAEGGRRRARDLRPRRFLPRRDDRRSDDPRRQRALPDVHLARRVPAVAARRQRRRAADRQGRRVRLRRAGAGASSTGRTQAQLDGRAGACSRSATASPGDARSRSVSRSIRTACAARRSSSRRSRSSRLRRLRGSGRRLADIPAALVARLEADAKYAVYVERQAEDVARYRRDDALLLPEDLDYAGAAGAVARDAAEVLRGAAAQPRARRGGSRA